MQLTTFRFWRSENSRLWEELDQEEDKGVTVYIKKIDGCVNFKMDSENISECYSLIVSLLCWLTVLLGRVLRFIYKKNVIKVYILKGIIMKINWSIIDFQIGFVVMRYLINRELIT